MWMNVNTWIMLSFNKYIFHSSQHHIKDQNLGASLHAFKLYIYCYEHIHNVGCDRITWIGTLQMLYQVLFFIFMQRISIKNWITFFVKNYWCQTKLTQPEIISLSCRHQVLPLRLGLYLSLQCCCLGGSLISRNFQCNSAVIHQESKLWPKKISRCALKQVATVGYLIIPNNPCLIM